MNDNEKLEQYYKYLDNIKKLASDEEGKAEREKQARAILKALSEVKPIEYEEGNTENILTIPDVHGDLFTALFPLVRNGIIKISFNETGEVIFKEGDNISKFKRIVYLGDYVDRGPYSLEVIDTLEKIYDLINGKDVDSIKEDNKLVLLAGNHDLSAVGMVKENGIQQRKLFQKRLKKFAEKLRFFYKENIKGKHFIFSHAPLVDNYRTQSAEELINESLKEAKPNCRFISSLVELNEYYKKYFYRNEKDIELKLLKKGTEQYGVYGHKVILNTSKYVDYGRDNRLEQLNNNISGRHAYSLDFGNSVGFSKIKGDSGYSSSSSYCIFDNKGGYRVEMATCEYEEDFFSAKKNR